MGRPDLEEFLSALSGFVDRQSASPDSGYLKFLDIFCRSVGSTEGHLLRPDAAARLESVASFGVDATFDRDYNATRDGGASPIDSAFSGHRVVAMVEIKEGAVPGWFFDLMTRYGYRSFVSVPIIGPKGPTGVLCAYYRDVCLFDQGTLDRLATVGRMLGGTETAPAKDKESGKRPERYATEPDAGDTIAADFAKALTERVFNKIQVFGYLVKTVGRAFDSSGVICGPVRIMAGEMVITVADGQGVPAAAVSHRLSLPPAVRVQLLHGEGAFSLAGPSQGELKNLIKSNSASVLGQPILWQGKIHGAIVAWRPGSHPFSDNDDRRLARIAAIAALALNAV